MFNLHAYTLVHVALSLIGIASGLVVAAGFMSAKRLGTATWIFLSTTVLTSVTGFGFPFDHALPSHAVGCLSLLVLVVAIIARYGKQLAGPWRWIYVVTAMLAFYFNVFVLVVQLFRRVPALQSLAPTQSEPPFAIAQGIVLLIFIAATALAVRAFKPTGVA